MIATGGALNTRMETLVLKVLAKRRSVSSADGVGVVTDGVVLHGNFYWVVIITESKGTPSLHL